MRRPRSFVLGAAVLALLLLVGGCAEDEPGGDDNDIATDQTETAALRPTITVGVSGAFTENQLVAEMYALVLEEAGYQVQRQLDLGSREISDPALFSGQIDVKPEYLASELAFVDPGADPSPDPAENARLLAEALEDQPVEVLEYSEAQDQNVFVVTPETAAQYDLDSVSDLQPVAGDLTLGGPAECPRRPYCLIGLRRVYDVEFAEFQPLDPGGPATVAALQEEQIDVALLFSTNPVIAANDWVVLEDDRGLQAAENIVPIIHEEVANAEVEQLLNRVSDALTTETLMELIGRVDLEGEDVAEVAREFAQQQGLI